MKADIVNQAIELIGSPSIRYVRGHPEYGQSPEDGFDCSGFVRFVLQESGVMVPDYIGIDGHRRSVRHANEFWDHYGVHIHDGNHEPGDLIFFTRQGMFPTHIGIVRDEESYIHSPGKDNRTVEVTSIEESEVVPNRDLGRVIFTRNPIGFKAHTALLDEPSYRHFQEVI